MREKSVTDESEVSTAAEPLFSTPKSYALLAGHLLLFNSFFHIFLIVMISVVTIILKDINLNFKILSVNKKRKKNEKKNLHKVQFFFYRPINLAPYLTSAAEV